METLAFLSIAIFGMFALLAVVGLWICACEGVDPARLDDDLDRLEREGKGV